MEAGQDRALGDAPAACRSDHTAECAGVEHGRRPPPVGAYDPLHVADDRVKVRAPVVRDNGPPPGDARELGERRGLFVLRLVMQVAERKDEVGGGRSERRGTAQVGLHESRPAPDHRQGCEPPACDVGAHDRAARDPVEKRRQAPIARRHVENDARASGAREQSRDDPPLAPVDKPLRAAVPMAEIGATFPPAARRARRHRIAQHRAGDVQASDRGQRRSENRPMRAACRDGREQAPEAREAELEATRDGQSSPLVHASQDAVLDLTPA